MNLKTNSDCDRRTREATRLGEDVEMLEDLVLAALNDAVLNAGQLVQGPDLGGLDLGSMGLGGLLGGSD